MSVLVEALSVILKATSITQTYTGGLKDFAVFCRRINNSYCTDGELVRIGFTRPEDMKPFVEKMGLAGLVSHRGGEAVDLVIADQREGFERICAWARMSEDAAPGAADKSVKSCRLVGGSADKLVVPEGWTYQSSISAREAQARSRQVPAAVPPFAVFAHRPGDAASLAMAMRRKKK